MGSIYYSKKDFDKAEEYYLKSIKIKEKILDQNSIEKATTLNNLGYIYIAKSEMDKAKKYCHEALIILEG